MAKAQAYHVIDEDKTDKLMEEREANIKLNAIKKEQENVGQGDLVQAIGNMAKAYQGKGAQPEQKAFKDMSLKELKIYCIENDIEHHPSAQEANIIGKIEESLKQA